MKLFQLRRDAYRAARALGDAQAVRKGPAGVAKRVVRRKVYRKTNTATRRILKGFGL